MIEDNFTWMKALLVIDMLKDFMPKSIYPEAKLPVEPAAQIIPEIEDVISHARQKNIPIFYVNDSHEKNDPEFEEWPEHCIEGAEGAEVVPQLKPEEEDTVISKKTYNGFSNPKLEKELKAQRVEKLYIVGVVTDICVLNTALEAKERGYHVKVIEECVSGLDSRKDGLKKLKEKGIRVIPKDKFLEEV